MNKHGTFGRMNSDQGIIQKFKCQIRETNDKSVSWGHWFFAVTNEGPGDPVRNKIIATFAVNCIPNDGVAGLIQFAMESHDIDPVYHDRYKHIDSSDSIMEFYLNTEEITQILNTKFIKGTDVNGNKYNLITNNCRHILITTLIPYLTENEITMLNAENVLRVMTNFTLLLK